MSILIKGMEMPQNCLLCPLYASCDYRPTWRTITGSSFDKRPAECPLIEIPTPHGRLIDADALSEIAGKRCGVINIGHIDEAHTIIEAEGGGEADQKTNCSNCGNRNAPVCKYCEHDAEGGGEDG